jgi:hypothetical protein
MSTVTVYRSTDANAPILNNQDATSLIALLNACLVTGYGAKAGAGWSAPFTTTGITVFKTGTPSNGMYLRVASGSYGGQQGCLATGAPTTTSTALTDMVSPFPTTTQIADGGVYWLSGVQSPNTTPGKWTLVADAAFMHLELQTNMSNGWYRQHYMFGDIMPPTSDIVDPSNTMIIGCGNTNQDAGSGWNYGAGTHQPYFNSDPRVGWYMSSGYTQNTGSIPIGWTANAFVTTSYWHASGLTYPNPSDGGFYLSPVYVYDKGPSGSNYINYRGTVPGLYVPCHIKAVGDGAVFSGTGPLAGKQFQCINSYTDLTQDIRGVAVQLSNWR